MAFPATCRQPATDETSAVMSSDPIVCPFCNSTITGVDRKPGASSALCPRCGESLPEDIARRLPALTAAPSAAGLEPSSPTLQTLNQRLGTSIVMLMVLMAVLAAGMAIATVDTRRGRDSAAVPGGSVRATSMAVVPSPVTPSDTTPVEPSTKKPGEKPAADTPKPAPRGDAPADLAALHYLPQDSNLIVGVQAADMLKDPAWIGLMFRLMTAAGDGKSPLGRFETLTGFKPEQIDHVVIAGRMSDDNFGGLMVIRTKAPVERDALKQRLKVFEPEEFGSRSAFPFRTPGFPFKPLLCFIDDTTVLIGLGPDDMDHVPEKPVPGVKHLPPVIQTLFAERLSPTAKVWVAGERLDRWKTVPILPPGMISDQEQDLIGLTDQVAAWIEPGPDAALRLRLKPLKPAGESELRRYFESRRGAKGTDEKGWLDITLPVAGFMPKTAATKGPK